MSRGGSSFCTHRLRQRPGRLEFRASFGALLFVSVAVCTGLALMLLPLLLLKVAFWPVVMWSGAGAFFVLSVSLSLRDELRATVFDFENGSLYRGRRPPGSGLRGGGKDLLGLERIYALQLLSKFMQGRDSSYMSYELNLVLDDASRHHVVGHGGLVALRADAQRLADALSKPLWDAA